MHLDTQTLEYERRKVVECLYAPGTSFLEQRLRDWHYALGSEKLRYARVIEARVVCIALTGQSLRFREQAGELRLEAYLRAAQLPQLVRRKLGYSNE